MICSSCNEDNPRSAVECASCGSKMSVIRCRCGFVNSLMDSYCGSCGKQLMKTNILSRIQRFESSANPYPSFTEEELMRIIEVQQIHTQFEQQPNSVNQSDIDKLFE